MSPRQVVIACLGVLLCWGGGGVPQTFGQEPSTLQRRIDALAQQIHLRYRNNESARDLQRDAVKSVLESWNAVAGRGDDGGNRDALSAWIDRALRATMPGGSGRLPAAPAFSAPAPLVESVRPAPPARPTPSEPAPGRPGASGSDASIPTAAPNSVVVENPFYGTNPRTRPAPRGGAAGKDRSLFAAPRATPASPSHRPNRREVAKPELPSRSKWSRHPAAAPLEWRDPFADDPSASRDPRRGGGERYETRRPAFSEAAAVSVNLTELAAQVRGYNAAIRGLQQRLTTGRGADAMALYGIATELEQLVEQRRFLDLYREGLPAAEQRSLPPSPSAELVQELVRRRAEELLSDTTAEDRVERRVLRKLTDRLAKVR